MKNFSNSATIYLSPLNGDDHLSGYAPIANGFGDGPIKSFQRLLEMVRSMRLCNVFNPVTVKILGDVYLSDTVLLDQTCNDICFEAFDDKPIKIIGGKRITGFSKDCLNGVECLSVVLPEVKSGTWSFTDLYVNGKRATLSRYPRASFLKAETTEYPNPNGDFIPSKWFIAEKNSVEAIDDIEHATVSFCHYFIDEHSPIESYDADTRKITLKYLPCMTMATNYESVNPSTFLYYLENVRKGFLSKGDWYLDVKNGKLYYFPLDGQNAENIEVFAPTTKRLFSIVGDERRKARNIRFRNLSFTCSKGDYIGKNENTDERAYASDQQSWVFAFGAVSFENAANCSIQHCKFYALGLHAIELKTGCTAIRIENNEIHDIGGGGIKVLGAPHGAPETQNSQYNVFNHNCIHDCGQRYYAACGVLLAHTSHNEISDNTIYNINYTGISVGWVWGYDESSAYANIIRRNHVHHIGMGPLSDMGAIYLLGKQNGTIVEENIVHDVESKHGGTYGLYADEGTSFAVFERNIVYNTMLASFHVHLGNQTVVQNNVFAFGKQNIVNVSMYENHSMAIFERNVFVADQEKIYGNSYKHYLYPNPSFYSDENLIISLNGQPVFTKIGENARPVYFEQWTSVYGLDKNSKVLTTQQDLHEYFENIPSLIEKIGIEKTVLQVFKQLKKQ
ncbi:MAG: right-handed parallel beta-helix repeat-containing protein [Clostridia bacterium]|nr:right-handed parallel beta-helix repeat-containing protein [Clostridia bacterium]